MLKVFQGSVASTKLSVVQQIIVVYCKNHSYSTFTGYRGTLTQYRGEATNSRDADKSRYVAKTGKILTSTVF